MRPDDLRTLFKRQLFEPVRIGLSDGSSLLVRHPDQVVVAERHLLIGLARLQRFKPPGHPHARWLGKCLADGRCEKPSYPEEEFGGLGGGDAGEVEDEVPARGRVGLGTGADPAYPPAVRSKPITAHAVPQSLDTT